MLFDLTDRKRAEERQLTLAHEVEHRAKNLLAVVAALLRLTRAETIKDYIDTIQGRIGALAGIHNLLVVQIIHATVGAIIVVLLARAIAWG